MARFTLSWRQVENGPTGTGFAHRMAYAHGAAAVLEIADGLGDRAWRREFRLLRGASEVFTDLHRIQDWMRLTAELPGPAPHHMWRRDLERDLAADQLLEALRAGAAPAVTAGVLPRADADALFRFARGSLRRPNL